MRSFSIIQATFRKNGNTLDNSAIGAGLGLHTVNTKRYDTGTGTGETVPVVSVSLTVKRYL